MSNIHKLYETNRLQFAFRLHYLLFIVSIHMHISSVANYALDVHLNRKSVKHCITHTSETGCSDMSEVVCYLS